MVVELPSWAIPFLAGVAGTFVLSVVANLATPFFKLAGLSAFSSVKSLQSTSRAIQVVELEAWIENPHLATQDCIKVLMLFILSAIAAISYSFPIATITMQEILLSHKYNFHSVYPIAFIIFLVSMNTYCYFRIVSNCSKMYNPKTRLENMKKKYANIEGFEEHLSSVRAKYLDRNV